MKKIPLSRGKFAMVDDEDFEWLSGYKWYLSGDLRLCPGYAASAGVKSISTSQLMHRAIMNPNSNMEVDHIDGDTLNNQRSNLRVVSHLINGQNKHKYTRAASLDPNLKYPEKTIQLMGDGGVSLTEGEP
jgi:hypothetical protein